MVELIALLVAVGAFALVVVWAVGRRKQPDDAGGASTRAVAPVRGVSASSAPETPTTTVAGGATGATSATSARVASAERAKLPSLVRDEDDDEATDLVEVPHGLRRGESEQASLRVHFDDAPVDEPTGVHEVILVSAVAQSDRGRRRRHNEDSFAIEHEHALFAVADGMGGHQAGDVASQLAVRTLLETFADGGFTAAGGALPRRGHELIEAFSRANEAVFSRARDDSALRGMGTTLVAARFTPKKRRAYIAHVGDSRCYRLRGGELRQLTTDHTFSTLTGATGSLGAKLTRALGTQSTVEVDLGIDAPAPRDRYLLCSDGLTRVLDDALIAATLVRHTNLQEAAHELVDLANARGGPDNVTVVLVRVDPVSEVRIAS